MPIEYKVLSFIAATQEILDPQDVNYLNHIAFEDYSIKEIIHKLLPWLFK